jgi:four helix bundle protein
MTLYALFSTDKSREVVTNDLVLLGPEFERLERNNGGTMATSYRDLRVWQCSMKLVTHVYAITQQFPKQEIYGLVSQMRRSAVSIPSNIAEGKGRMTDPDRAHFFAHARGSLLELETQVLISRELNYVSVEDCGSLMRQLSEVGRMLNALVDSIRPKFKQAV